MYDDVICFNAEEIAKNLSSQGGRAYTAIIQNFGSILEKSGELDRKKLAEIVFEDDKKLTLLESIVHPLVKKELEDKITECVKESKKKRRAKKKVILVEVPLLYEAKFEDLFDAVLLVACSEDQQIFRAQKRDNLSEDAIRRRMMRQIPLREKVEKAHFIIDNNVTMNEMRKQLEVLWLKVVQTKQK